MNLNPFNDTFDNISLTQLQNNALNENLHESVKSDEKREISFDDSNFLNESQISFTQIENLAKSKDESFKSDKSLNFDEFKFNESFKNQSNNEESLKNITKNDDSLFEDESFKEDKSPAKPQTTNSNKLSDWGLPQSILDSYSSRKITTMFPWQVECLSNPKVLVEGKNLIYSAPTSAGKTLVAEILTIKTIVERRKKVIFILPFVSVVREKMFYFQEVLASNGIRVDGFMGAYNPPGGFNSVQLAICTIEKANSLINKLLSEGIRDIGAVVIDEMHLLGDASRGYLLELLLTKLRYVASKDDSLGIQIIGMSATLPNLSDLAQWLNAELYTTDFRPIPLNEQTLINGEIFDNVLKPIRKLKPFPELNTDTDNVLQLCLETILDSCSVLIFCPTKNWCENLAQQIAQAFLNLGSGSSQLGLALRKQLSAVLIMELLGQLKFCPIGLDEILRKTVSFGVAFHHAGLTMDERDIIETGFKNGIIRVLVATSTLSSGVNLPARRVIIRTPNFHGKPIDSLCYKQMIGRAGRMGKDTIGESILICQKNDMKIVENLMRVKLEPIQSCLESDGKLKRAILEIVASSIASTIQDIELFTNCTLLKNQLTDLHNPVDDSLEWLIKNEFIRLQQTESGVLYQPTNLAKACLQSSLPPEEGLSLFTELEKSRQCFVLESELHLIYLVTPYSACHQWGNIDWMLYMELWEKLSTSMKKVAELIGVKESYIINATKGRNTINTQKLYHKLLIHKRFFVALALQDLVNERPLQEVCCKFSCNRGMLQSLQQTASTFAGMVTAFSHQLGWTSIEILVEQFQERLQFGVSRDLLDLMRLPILNQKCARALFNSGLETLVKLANSKSNTIENILNKVMPFESAKMREGETEHQTKERNKIKNIWITGKEGLTETEAADLLLKSARNFLQLEMGLKEAKWAENTKSETDRLFVKPKNSFDDSFNLTSLNISSASSKSIFSNESGKISDKSLFEDDSLTENCWVLKELNLATPKKRRRPMNDSYTETPSKKQKPDGDLEIIDVCADEKFIRELKQQKDICLSIACCRIDENKQIIGVKLNNEMKPFTCKNRKIDGFAINWGENVVYYVSLENSQQLEAIKSIFSDAEFSVKMFDCKEQIKLLRSACNIDLKAKIDDPKVIDWILEPVEGKEKSLDLMVYNYCPGLARFLRSCGNFKGTGSFGLNIHNEVAAKIRASTEAMITWKLMKKIKKLLMSQNTKLLATYGTEMQCLKILSEMELIGIGANMTILKNLMTTINQQSAKIETKAFSLAGRRFSFTASSDIASILGLPKTRGRISARKEILEKHTNPTSDLILGWRKLNFTKTKLIQPLIKAVAYNRIYGRYIFHTATGRISMHEPNLQNVAKSFKIADFNEINCRSAFIPKLGCVFLSADYCQLELRILAHFSQDPHLCQIMRREGDIFRRIAAKWNKINETEVDDNVRQNTKQLCYGIIYGMGNKAMAEKLVVNEESAREFVDSFKNTYPGIKKLIEETIECCRKNGFVETIGGRRRFLPHINHENPALKSQAERQAVNTTIQGSAADIVKKAMICLEKSFNKFKSKPNLVLHLHDELLFEVPEKNLKNIAIMLKFDMEQSAKLSIPLPVKLKFGKSWGQMTDYTV